MKPIRILLVDDHTIVRRGLTALLRTNCRYVVVGEAKDGEEALLRLTMVEADIAVVDLFMPRLDGLATIQRIAREHPKVKVIVLSMYDDEQFVAQALHNGARGYVLKQAMDDELFNALDKVAQGGKYVSPEIDLQHVESRHMEEPDLSAREREVLQLIVDGHTTHDLANILTISPHTATRHRANLMRKLRVHTQVEVVRAAAERGLLVLPKPPLGI